MRPYTKLLFFLLLPFITTSYISDNTIQWELEKSKDGISVYSHIAEGEKLKQLKSHTRVKASMSTIITLLSDADNYTNWIYKCVKSKKLKAINNKTMVYYTQSDAPWPILNRELYVYNKFHQNAKSKIVYSISKPLPNNKIPLKKGIIRVTDFEGKWKFTPLKNGEIAIDYFLKLDPAGRVPTWLLNMTLEVGPYQTLVNFKKELKKEKYLQHKATFIDE